MSFPAPNAHPIVVVLQHDLGIKLTVDAHTYPDGELCVQHSDSGDIDYQREGLRGYMQHVAVHLHRIVLFKHLGRWPGPALAHGPAGITQLYRSKLKQPVHRFLDEKTELPSKNSLCPCGSRSRFQRCCRDVVREGRRRLAEMRSLLAHVAASKPISPANR
ncbi:SEC-C metal-binding domain-containing protein [Myxococcus xanthus]|uniref:SEC-C metal-binding domain-containing protein n=1 Tax=Myxococcus xanthus TaxID=34 RepID=UPI00115FB8E3|nr:SEC-C metal-binding domain-containing protein [Myxococcus xanthus]QVW70548.1 hypothetical protein JTM82_13770 [Myxococcus xanthus DZ2]UEO03324.1 SEC-C domain-containing protein [Myxococcus xanthus DZ2]UYI16513.1 SEC-C metal-binding domain-containing protein [Myxococcus xanthus]UYI23875.1 SEC-C metal-binding domain-containing protein [Myxococcus xanthus]